MLGVERCHATRAGCGDGLTVGWVDHVATGEYARQRSFRRAAVYLHELFFGQLNLVFDQPNARVVTDCDEQPIESEFAGRVIHCALQGHTGELAFAVQSLDGAVVNDLDLWVGQCAVLHDLRCLEGVAAVNQVNLVGETGQEVGFFHGAVATANNRNGLLSKEETVAGGTPRNSVTAEFFFALDAELAVGSAGGKNYGL